MRGFQTVRLCFVLLAAGVAALAGPAGAQDLKLEVVSTRPEYVTGGDALIAVALPPGARPNTLRVRLNGADVTRAFAPDPARPDRRLGLVGGLVLGANTIEARSGAASTRLDLVNYPAAGPVFSGPHIRPFVCQTQDFVLPDGSRLPPASDPETCAVAPVVQHVYLPQGADAFRPLPPGAALPADVASVVTTAGVRTPFVVRVETGVVDRGIYQFAVLHDPTREGAPSPTAAPRAWNHRLVSIQGAGCTGGWYIQGRVMGDTPPRAGGIRAQMLDPVRLGQGYAIIGNTLQHPSNNCNAVLASEAGLMTKERFIEIFGPPVWTVSHGCSGGSYGSAQLADRLPGLYDGVLIACTFPDPLAIATEGQDSRLLAHYWAATDPQGFTDAQKLAVTGYKTIKAFLDAANQAARTDPVARPDDLAGYGSGAFSPAVATDLRYDPKTRPDGARPTIYDAARNIYGVDPQTGFALRTYDNVGVQYGLEVLKAGAISKAQFLDLNTRVGGYDQDGGYAAARSQGDVGAITRAKLSGLQTGGAGGLAQIPVFDVTGTYNDDAAYHYQWFHFALRDRMRQANGDADNHVMWRGNPVPYDDAWTAFTSWVDRYKADAGPGDQRAKVIRAKAAMDGCFDAEGRFVAQPQTLSSRPDASCNALLPSFSATRLMADGPLAADVLKCRLKPVDPADYGAVRFSEAELDRLRAAFPEGVCDWSRGDASGVKAALPYASFGPSPINRVEVPGLDSRAVVRP